MLFSVIKNFTIENFILVFIPFRIERVMDSDQLSDGQKSDA